MQTGKAFLHRGPILSRHRKNSDSRIIGRDDFKFPVLHMLEGLLPVALSTENPDVTNQNILQSESLVLAFDGEGLRFGISLMPGSVIFQDRSLPALASLV